MPSGFSLTQQKVIDKYAPLPTIHANIDHSESAEVTRNLASSIEYSLINIGNNISNKRINYNDDGLAALPLTDHQNALVCLSISEFWQDREQK